ncbi:MAG: ABC transporter ATP-binding protein [Bacillota bacterium]
MLRACDITVGYGDMMAIHGISFEVRQGEIVCIVGANGAGKSTILRTVSGLLKPVSGTLEFQGVRLDRMEPHDITALGIAHVPEGRRLFSRLSVKDNLLLGAHALGDRGDVASGLEMVYELFPVLKERSQQRAGTMSGGEQQMVAIGRGLMLRPRLRMLDEPSLGIAPALVERILTSIAEINGQFGTTILLVEQNVVEALEISHRAYVIQSGELLASGASREILESETVKKAYLGMF